MAVSKNKARIPKQIRAIQSKEKIIEAATALFAEKGYHKTNALEIAARAEVATGTFYSYFNNKKEVFIEIIKLIFKTIIEKMLINYQLKIHKKRANNYHEVKNMIHFMIYNIFSEFLCFEAQLIKEILSMALLDKEIDKMHHREQRKVVNYLIPYMQICQKYIRISDFEAASVLLINTVEHIIHQIIFTNTGVDEKRLLKEAEDMICRYLMPDQK
jgi:AcrR family transcriptional regulator